MTTPSSSSAIEGSHCKIARAAIERGWLSIENFWTRLSNLGADASSCSLEDFWVKGGLLSIQSLQSLIAAELSFEAQETIGHDGLLPPIAQSLLKHQEPSGGFPSLGDPLQTRPIEAVDPHTKGGGAVSSEEFFSEFPTQHLPLPLPLPLNATHHSEHLLFGALAQGNISGDMPIVSSSRYLLKEEVGRGGSGRVFRALDRALKRHVAMKVLRAPGQGAERKQRVDRFIQEARATGCLEHPNIIPIYDVGSLEGGEVFYTMKFVRRHALREIIRQLAVDNEEIRREYNLTTLLQIFLPVCLAVHYAHAQGIVHRDLKPDNIMIGDYGEVLVADWGLARLLVEPAESFEGSEGQGPQTLGTPAYMSPEQAQGRLELVDELSDIYSLGAILYEILALCPPVVGSSPEMILLRAAKGEIDAPRKRAPNRHIPKDLEEICARALSFNRAQRFATAKALHDAVLRFLDGHQDREARRKIYLGHFSSREYFEAIGEIKDREQEVRRLRSQVEDWRPLDLKKPIWRLEDSVQRMRTRMGRSYSDGVRAYTQALAYNSDATEARKGLAKLYWSRFQAAEKEQQVTDQIHFEALLRQVDREEHYTPLLEGDGSLELITHPAGARVTLYRFKENNRLMLPQDPQNCGTSPLLKGLSMGSYLAYIEAPGYHPIRYPVQIRRGQRWRGHAQMISASVVPKGFCFISAGPFSSGGDSQAPNAGPGETRHLESFFIAQYPITFADYLAFLDHLQSEDPAEAIRRAPSARGKDGELARVEAGRWVPRSEILIEGDARKRYPEGQGYEWSLPVVCVSVDDVLAFIEWRSQIDGLRYRLPDTWEWEKAARGVDGRFFPWGNTFDATFCKVSTSRPETAQPEPIGVFISDESVYGVRDLAGNVQEWCSDESWFDSSFSSNTLQNPSSKIHLKLPESSHARGGSWNHFSVASRVSNHSKIISIGRSSSLGFRLAISLTTAGFPERLDDLETDS